MNTKSPYIVALVCLLSFAMAMPLDILAGQQQTPNPRAGEVSRVIPAVNIARGSKSINASPKTVVDWQEIGRAHV